MGHTAWGLSLAWITISCSSGYGGPVTSFLNCRVFLPLSRLTYCAYLVHPVIMCITSFHLDGALHLDNSMTVSKTDERDVINQKALVLLQTTRKAMSRLFCGHKYNRYESKTCILNDF